MDKSDVRIIFHTSIPSSMHEYAQQIGRAGRDGKESICILFYRFQDWSIHLSHIFHNESEISRRNGLKELKNVVKFCTVSSCLKSEILTFFGEDFDFVCSSMCSNCLMEKHLLKKKDN